MLNIAAGQQTSILDIVRHVNKILKTDLQPIHEPERPGDVRISFADIRRARDLIGHEPQVEMEEGLTRTVKYFQDLLGV